MLIYKFTHLPTNKIYIGSLKNSSRWSSYNSSSKVVSKMMVERPEEWKREVLHDQFDPRWTYKEVVDLENELIREQVILVGWDSIWNKHYGANAYSPEALAAAQAVKETPEWKAQRSINSKKWFDQNPDKAEERRIKITRTMIESTPRLREIQLEFIRNNPELHKARQEAANAGKRTVEGRQNNSSAKKEWYATNPDGKAKLFAKITETKQTVASKQRMSAGQKERFSREEEKQRLKDNATERFSKIQERTLASQRTSKFFSDQENLHHHTNKQRKRFGKLIEVTFNDGTTYQCLGRKAMETTLGCFGILRIIKGLRKFGTCTSEAFNGKVVVSARYVADGSVD